MSNYALRLPDSLKKEAEKLAAEDHTSLNQMFVLAIAKEIAARRTEQLIKERSAKADLSKAIKVLNKIKDLDEKNHL